MREFLYDLSHPRQLVRRAKPGIDGPIALMMATAGLYVLGGIAFIVVGYVR